MGVPPVTPNQETSPEILVLIGKLAFWLIFMVGRCLVWKDNCDRKPRRLTEGVLKRHRWVYGQHENVAWRFAQKPAAVAELAWSTSWLQAVSIDHFFCNKSQVLWADSQSGNTIPTLEAWAIVHPWSTHIHIAAERFCKSQSVIHLSPSLPIECMRLQLHIELTIDVCIYVLVLQTPSRLLN
jgi:hypothetical protein